MHAPGDGICWFIKNFLNESYLGYWMAKLLVRAAIAGSPQTVMTCRRAAEIPAKLQEHTRVHTCAVLPQKTKKTCSYGFRFNGQQAQFNHELLVI